jgi:hypothetical protein
MYENLERRIGPLAIAGAIGIGAISCGDTSIAHGPRTNPFMPGKPELYQSYAWTEKRTGHEILRAELYEGVQTSDGFGDILVETRIPAYGLRVNVKEPGPMFDGKGSWPINRLFHQDIIKYFMPQGACKVTAYSQEGDRSGSYTEYPSSAATTRFYELKQWVEREGKHDARAERRHQFRDFVKHKGGKSHR